MLVDSNVLMYAAGAPHPNKRPSLELLKQVAMGEVDAVVDAELLQEILHRYRAIKRWRDGRRLYDEARRLFPVVIPVDGAVIDLARDLMDEIPRLVARDAVHAAVVLHHGLAGLCSFDTDFDRIDGLRRVAPADVLAG